MKTKIELLGKILSKTDQKLIFGGYVDEGDKKCSTGEGGFGSCKRGSTCHNGNDCWAPPTSEVQGCCVTVAA